MEMVNMHEKQLFMDGKKLVAIISEAGSAGVSLQADRRAINQVDLVVLFFSFPWHDSLVSLAIYVMECMFYSTLRFCSKTVNF